MCILLHLYQFKLYLHWPFSILWFYCGKKTVTIWSFSKENQNGKFLYSYSSKKEFIYYFTEISIFTLFYRPQNKIRFQIHLLRGYKFPYAYTNLDGLMNKNIQEHRKIIKTLHCVYYLRNSHSKNHDFDEIPENCDNF